MNRFTEKLDAIVPKDEYIKWWDLNEILPREFVMTISQYRARFEFEEFHPIKVLICAFIAEMSDEDLMEVFGI